jgi:hypothetical protein
MPLSRVLVDGRNVDVNIAELGVELGKQQTTGHSDCRQEVVINGTAD